MHIQNEPSDPLLLADGTLHCGMYPAGKVDISRLLAIMDFPRVTVLSASPVRMLVHFVVKHSRPLDLKSSSNVSLPFAWIKDPHKRTQLVSLVFLSLRKFRAESDLPINR